MQLGVARLASCNYPLEYRSDRGSLVPICFDLWLPVCRLVFTNPWRD